MYIYVVYRERERDRQRQKERYVYILNAHVCIFKDDHKFPDFNIF